MVWSNIHYLPIASFILLPGTFVTTYFYKNDVTILFPYISDTGNRVPESCIFSQFVNLSAYLFMFTIYIRYKQVEKYIRDHLTLESEKIFRINYFSFVIGIISCLGLSVVANFQEINLRAVHLSGAITCFTSGLIYCILQTWISHLAYPLLNSRLVAKVRLFLTLLMFCSYVTSMTLGPYALSIFDGEDRTRWKPSERGYIPHLIAAFGEWITMFCLNFFLLSYTNEMQKIGVSGPKIYVTIDNVNLITNNENENSNYANQTHIEIESGTSMIDSENNQYIIG